MAAALMITRLFMMLQDDISNQDMPFAVGFTLEHLGAHTVDEQGQKAFITNSPMELLRKVCCRMSTALHWNMSVHQLAGNQLK